MAALVLGLACLLRLAAGPVSLQDYAGSVGDALASRIGRGWTVTLADTVLELRGLHPAVRATGLEIRNPLGALVVRAPSAVVSLDPLSLLSGTFSPREIELRDLDLRASIATDGTLSVVPQGEAAAAAVASEPAPSGASTPVPADAAVAKAPPSDSSMSAALASLLDPLVEPNGLIGALDRATVIGARLTLIGPDGRERAAFRRLGAVFQQMEDGDRRLELEFEGQRGAWRVYGQVHGGPERHAEVFADGVPLTDLMLLTGMSRMSAGSDLRLGGRVSAAFTGRRISRLEGRIETSSGSINRTGRSALPIDRATLAASWDEAGRLLRLTEIDVLSEGTRFRLAGELAQKDPEGWRLKLSGRDAIVAGVGPRDPTFEVGAVAAEVSFGDAGVSLDGASLKGEGLDLELSGTVVPGQDGPTVRATIEARRTSARRLLRLWPDSLNPDLRAYLAARLSAGTVERLRLRSILDPRDLKTISTDIPMTDGSLDLRFTVSGAELAVVDGMPPLRGLALEGRASGQKASLLARDGSIVMPDGRRLVFTDASFVQKDVGKPAQPAQIAFRVTGGLDALASFMKSPRIREAGAPELDPATLRGQVDLRATLALVTSRIPPVADLPLAVTGTLSDVAADKLPGRERLEGGRFTVSRDAAGWAVRGEGRLTGSPATFDLQIPRAGGGELAIATVLDDAARLRRSFPVAPLLSGLVPVKAVIGFGPRPEVRVEADLGRAAIDGLVPGWVKPASKPGRLSFVLGEGEGSELRDLAVESGSVQIRGQASLTPSGGLDRADLSTFRLSPGDDLRAQVEHLSSGGYRIALKGGNADVRPILKWMAAVPARSGSGREPPDVDVDLAVAILSGFNDEALTGVSGKLATRAGELRSLSFNGRFRSAAVEAQLAKRDAGAPILSVRSGDAGATLRFLDLYRRMAGGRLSLDARSGEGVQEGRVTIEEFGLRNEPALRSIASQAIVQQPGASDERGVLPLARSDGDQVLFNRLNADFRRAGSRIDYTDAVIYGSQVGFNLAGFVDHGRDRLDITGTFVPAYVLNNVFSQVPVVGPLLGGGRNEGLFAVEFRVAGALSNPTLTVNPLTAVAPGILRKLFGWMLQDGSAVQETTSAAPGRRPTR